MRVTRWLPAVAVSVVAVPALLALAVWAWNHVTGRCGLLDEQGFACDPPFTAQEARSGAVTFELVRDESGADTHLVRFAVVNNTDAERTIGWHDLQLVTASGARTRCSWGDDSYPRYELLPGKRTVSYRSCEAPVGTLTLYYRDVQVASG